MQSQGLSPLHLQSGYRRDLNVGGRVRSRLNNVLIHLHNYTTGRYRGAWGDIVLLIGEVGWGRIRMRINLLEVCEGGVARNGNRKGFCPFSSNIVAFNTKTWEEGLEDG